MNGYIYITTNIVNGKQYIGQTTRNLSKRITEHKCQSGCPFFHKAIKKYGIKNFKWVPIEYPIEELDEMESFWINKLSTLKPNGYNLDTGGHINKKASEETKRKMSKSQTGRITSLETKIKLSKSKKGKKNHFYGKHHSKETIKIISEIKQNISDETRLKLSNAHKGKTCSEETRKKMSESHKKH